MRLSDLPPAGRVKRFVDRWFPARQILVRGPDRIAAIDVSQRTQLAVAATVCGLLLWSVCASVGIAVSFHSVASVVVADAKLHAAEHANEAAVARMKAETQALAAQRDQALAEMNSIRDAAVAQVVAQTAQALADADAKRDAALAQVKQLAAANTAALAALDARTQTAIGQVKTIIKATGLDPDRLAREAPAAATATAVPEAALRDDGLLNDLTQLDELGAVLGKMPLAAPVADISVTSPFGYRPNPWTGLREFHVGVDLRGPVGTPVYATAPGVVTYAGGMTGYGNIITIDHGYGLSTRYSHLEKMLVKVGATVALHQEIALLGNTGWSTGPHLLYETRVDGQPENPFNFMKVADDNVQK
jgi:murein DD-endopeptidase MepM/ murein hydrolase activator NlpD